MGYAMAASGRMQHDDKQTNWSRPSPSSARLPVLGSVQSGLTVGLDRTEPCPRPGPVRTGGIIAFPTGHAGFFLAAGFLFLAAWRLVLAE
jgi:hypothetical protein